MKLTEETYFTPKASQEFFSVSQFKSFLDCEASALAQIRGEWERPMTKALLEGSYVDAHFSGTMDYFLMKHNEVLNSRTGKPKAEYVKARAAIERAESDPFFMEFMTGDRQVILTGELFGERWKAKIDVLSDDKIVDLKYIKDTNKVYKKGEWKTFVDAYGYDLQGYIYQKLVEQETGKQLPFYLAVITKEDPCDLMVIEIPQKLLNVCEGMVQHYVKRFGAIKRGEIEPVRCEKCAYCRETKKLKSVTNYEDLMED